MKLLYIDTETTGLNPDNDRIVEIAAIYVNGEEESEFHAYIKHAKYKEDYDQVAKITGLTVDFLDRTGKEYREAYKEMIKFLSSKVDRFDPADKMILIGYNVRFDIEFLRRMFLHFDDKYFGSYFFTASVDVLSLVGECLALDLINPLMNFKLQTVADHFGLSFHAHSAMEDVNVTRALYKRLNEKLNRE